MQLTRPRQRAFSLTEMMIAVLIIAIMTSASVPRLLHRQDEWQVKAASFQLANDLRALANAATASSQSLDVQFLLANDRYIMPGTSDPSRPSLPYQVDLRERYGVDIVSTTLPTIPLPTLSFSGYGVPSSAVTILLARNNEQASVLVSATGQVSVTP
jgi:prepilin-type N-terminal cleavage/methylation domain-containing protein